MSYSNDSSLDKLPSLDSPWSISEASFDYIQKLILKTNSKTMVEFGSGNSTVRWLSANPNLHITSIEHQHKFYLQTKEQLNQLELSLRSNLYHAPLQKYWFRGRQFYSYRSIPLPSSCDIVLIDGPPHWTRRGREACLYNVYGSLKTGGIIILDDARRKDEQATVANWLSVYPDSFEHAFVDIGNGLSILTKTKDVAYSISRQAMMDFYTLSLSSVKFSTKVFLKANLDQLILRKRSE